MKIFLSNIILSYLIQRGVFLCLLLFPILILSQTKEQKIDSLKQVIENTNSDTVRVKTYMEWDNLIYSSDPQLDLEINFKVAEICAKNLDNINQLSESEVIVFKKHQGSAFNNLAIIFKNQGNFEAALEYNKKSLKIKEAIGDKKGISNTYINMGTIHHTKGDLIKALEYYYKCLAIREELNDQKGISSILINIGAIYHYQDDYTNALKFYRKSLDIKKKIEDKNEYNKAYSNIGFVYFEQGDSALNSGNKELAHQKFDAALENYIKCLNISKEKNDKNELAKIYNHIGTVYYKKGKLDIALEYFLMSSELNEELKSMQSLASSLSNVANIYLDKKQYDKALEIGTKAYDLAKTSNSILELNAITLMLHKIYKIKNNLNLSLSMLEEHYATKDSISSRESSLQTIQQQFKYEYDKKAAADSVKKAEEIKVKNAEINAQKAEASKQKLEIEYQKQQKFYLFLGIFGLLFFGVFLTNRLVVIQKQKKVIEGQKNEVELQKQQIEHQHHQLEETHQEISDSIKYAERLQLAILPSREDLNEHLGTGFVLFKPKDVVSGDFYWLHQLENSVLFAAADCTGHGVPGAMVSVVCSNSLNRSVKEFGLNNPGQILNKTRDLVIETFARSGKDVKDGMDISLVSMHKLIECEGKKKKVKIEFSGANNPLWILRNNTTEVEEVKGDKQPVSLSYNMTDFTSKEIILEEGDSIYLFTDGYADQFGGEKGKKFKYAPFKEFLLSIQDKSMDEQKMLIEEKFYSWKGDFEQVDDVCIIGVRV